jgi:ribosomal protein S18 acetylase RimI-like enzyme
MLNEALINNSFRPPVARSIRPAEMDEAERAMAIMLMAFSTDPVARWVYPEPSDYFQHFPDFIRGFAGNAFRNGTAYVNDQFSGAALWLPPGIQSDEEALAELIDNTVSENVREDLLLVMEAMGSYHPDGPHWYLPMIGVDTPQQGRGIGDELMRYALERCDADGLPAYLESSNPRNMSLYERCGFTSLGTIQFGNSTPVYPMVRGPQGDRQKGSATNKT